MDKHRGAMRPERAISAVSRAHTRARLSQAGDSPGKNCRPILTEAALNSSISWGSPWVATVPPPAPAGADVTGLTRARARGLAAADPPISYTTLVPIRVRATSENEHKALIV